MATGIVSVSLLLDGKKVISWILFAIAGGTWALIAANTAWRTRTSRDELRREAGAPAALSTVAATAVVGMRAALTGWTAVGIAALGAGFLIWVALLPRVLASHGWRSRGGASFLATVAAASLAVLAAAIARRTGASWLVYAALAGSAIGLALYVPVLAAFDRAELTRADGDQWVSGGALAIGALAVGLVAGASRRSGLDAVADPAATAALVIWALAVAWLPALLLGEVLRPRVRYRLARWSMVFPLGMYSASSYVVGNVNRAGALVEAARVWVWVAAAAWVLVLGGMLATARPLNAERRRRPRARSGR